MILQMTAKILKQKIIIIKKNKNKFKKSHRLEARDNAVLTKIGLGSMGV